MAKTVILVSDKSGEQVTEENGATVKITFPGEDTTQVIDLTRDEVDALFQDKKTGLLIGREQQKRGRKSGNGDSESDDDE